MGELTSAFDRSKEDGQAQWKKTRQAVMRRRAEAEEYAKAEQIGGGDLGCLQTSTQYTP